MLRWVVFTTHLLAAVRGGPCCAENQLFATSLGLCVDAQLGHQDSNFTEKSSGVINCSRGHQLLNYSTAEPVIEDNVLRETLFNTSVPADQYCTHASDDGQVVVFFCHRPTVKIKKCCPEGFAINGSSVGQCIQNSAPFNVDRIVNKSLITSHRLVSGPNTNRMSLQCHFDYNLFHPYPIFADNKFEILPPDELNKPGKLYVPRGHYSMFKYVPNEYCVDNFVNRAGNVSMTAAMCLPSDMFTLRWLLHDVYPYLHYNSVFFLLISLAVYLTYSKLRDTLHGFAMICFMSCMVVVQTEYGIIYQLPYVPHTWCFEKVRTTGFFRIASSAWITVMGFDVWMKIKCKEQLKTSRQIRLRVLFYSIYAWGVAICITMTAQIYLYVKNGGKKANLCWFGDPVVSGLIWYPNLTLVVCNLFFFLPSAYEVYKSKKFLSKGSTSMGKFELERIKAIFRLFILEEFYIIPRLIHWIVDADFTSDYILPYLLMTSVSAYVSLGPCVFIVFVCKGDVIKMIRKSITCRKPRIRRFWQTKSYSVESADFYKGSSSSNTTTSSVKRPSEAESYGNVAYQAD